MGGVRRFVRFMGLLGVHFTTNAQWVLSPHLRLGSREANRLPNLSGEEVTSAESAQLSVGIEETCDALRLAHEPEAPSADTSKRCPRIIHNIMLLP